MAFDIPIKTEQHYTINSNLFDYRPSDSFLVTYKETSADNVRAVKDIYQKAGFTDRITSIQQPAKSAELNSQNFLIFLESGESLLLRRCRRLQGIEKHEFLHKVFNTLKDNGISVPEYYTISKTFPYYEVDGVDGKVAFVFFKIIQAEKYFSGQRQELINATVQIGRMHACLKSFAKTDQIGTPAPFLKQDEWLSFKELIKNQKNPDHYDKLFYDNIDLIEQAIKAVVNGFDCLKEPDDFQYIHVDLNSMNFLSDEQNNITIMDFDDLQVGNIYTDIGFAFHRLITTCLERGEKDVPATIKSFLESYKKGNPEFNLDLSKLKIATYNRALKNIRANLDLKYLQNSSEWETSIPINIQRLKQIVFLLAILETYEKV